MPIVKLDKRDIPQIIENIEKNGGDASQLRAAIEDNTKKPGLSNAPNEISDDGYVETMMQKSPVQKGTDLECEACHAHVAVLYSGVCEVCFRPWALSTKRKDGRTSRI